MWRLPLEVLNWLRFEFCCLFRCSEVQNSVWRGSGQGGSIKENRWENVDQPCMSAWKSKTLKNDWFKLCINGGRGVASLKVKGMLAKMPVSQKMCKYHHLWTSFGGSDGICITEILLCSKYEHLLVLFTSEDQKMICLYVHFCHTCVPRSLHHIRCMPNTKWQHSWPCFSDFKQELFAASKH